jgi:hypothetical protein
MSVLTGAGVLAQARLLAEDTDPDAANQGLTAAQWLALINEAYYDLYELLGKARVQYVDSLTIDVSVTLASPRYSLATSSAVLYDLLALEYFQAAGAITTISEGDGTPLERMDPQEIRWLQKKKGTTGNPVYAGWARQEGTGKFLSWFFPIMRDPAGLATVHYMLAGYVKAYPTALVGSTETPDFTDSESYDLARIAAVRGCANLGDYDLAGKLAEQLPDKMQALVRGLERYAKPRPEQLQGAV